MKITKAPALTGIAVVPLRNVAFLLSFKKRRPICFDTAAKIRIHTDHNNLIARDLKSQRLLNWQMSIEEFSPELIYRKGEDNEVADQLSRLPLGF